MSASIESRNPRPILTHRLIHHTPKFDFEMVRIERMGKKPMDRAMVRHPGAVCVVPVLDDGRVVLIRNTRWAVSPKNGDPEVLWEVCAGTIDRDKTTGKPEDPAHCARRELVEECGYEAGTLTPLLPSNNDPEHPGAWFYTTPGMTDERMHPFAATGLKQVEQKLEEDEAITVEIVTAERLREMLRGGEIRDGKTMLSLMLAMEQGFIA